MSHSLHVSPLPKHCCLLIRRLYVGQYLLIQELREVTRVVELWEMSEVQELWEQRELGEILCDIWPIRLDFSFNSEYSISYESLTKY